MMCDPKMRNWRNGIVLIAFSGCLAGALPAAELPATCKASPALSEAMRSKPSTAVYDAVGAWFADKDQLSCALAAFQQATQLGPKSTEAHYDYGVALVRANKLERAASEFRAALAFQPSLTLARSALGSVLLDAGKPVEAETEFRELLRSDPASVFALDHLAQALSAQRRYDAAIQYWKQALARQPDSADMQLSLAAATYEDALAKQDTGIPGAHDNGTKEAIRLLTELTTAHPGMKAAHFTLANLFARESRFREAADEYAAVLRLDSNDAVALLAEVKALDTVSAYQEALPPAQEYVRLKPSDPEGHLLLGAVYRGLGEYAKAEPELARAVEGNPNDFQSQYQFGFVLARLDRPRDALLHLKKAVQLKPGDSSAQFQLSAVLRALGDSSQAAEAAQTFKKAKEDDFKVSQLAAQGNKANQYLQSGQPGQAAEVYRQMLQMEPRNAHTWYNLALALEAANDAGGAREALEKAAQIDPKMALAEGELGRMFLAAGDVKSARKSLEQAVALDPQLVSALGNLAIVYAQTGDNEKAEKLLRQALEDDSGYAQGHLNLGLILAQQRQYAEAETELRKALQLTPDDLRTLAAIGKVECRLGKTSEGVAFLERVAAAQPDSPGAHLDLAIAEADSYQLQRALAEAETAVRLAPDAAATHFNRGALLFDLGRPTEARDEFETAVRLAPEMPQPHYYLALIAKQNADYPTAIGNLQVVVKYDKRNVMAWHLLGQCLDEESKHADAIEGTGQNVRRVERVPPRAADSFSCLGTRSAALCAISAWKEALAINPQYTQTLWSLGHALKETEPEESARLLQRFEEIQKRNKILDQAGTLNNDAAALMQQGDWDTAATKLKQALQICTGCAAGRDIHKNLGLVYCHSGDLDRGERELRLAEAAQPGDPDVERALTLIAEARSKQAQTGQRVP